MEKRLDRQTNQRTHKQTKTIDEPGDKNATALTSLVELETTLHKSKDTITGSLFSTSSKTRIKELQNM